MYQPHPDPAGRVRRGTVYDGMGAAGVRADVALPGDRSVAVGDIPECGREPDAAGHAAAPGFIDMHAHDDFAVLLEPEMAFKVMQGVTTGVVGNCGTGVVPFRAGMARVGRFYPGATLEP